ncbi:hypothetical protein [Halocatena pleomorpha]|uniref:hypothetical protein n=1 Tax=Halocatena pleomorpha TaxID=1785090 RepID=UPI00163B49C6|nr:hypothetical protein [Halocatena pleomorpha]
MKNDRDRSTRADSSGWAEKPDEQRAITGPGEAYCMSCGELIEEAAAMCPRCGSEQPRAVDSRSDRSLTERRQYELEQVATKSRIIGMVLGFFAPPISYVYVNKWGWALLNVFTLNYLLLGFVIVPLHISNIISNAKERLRTAGVGGY